MAPLAARPERPVLTEADLAQIRAEVADDGLWVAPSYAATYGFTEADEDRVEQALVGLQKPVRVILVDPSYDDPEYQGDADRVVDAVAFEDPTPAVYLVTGPFQDIPRVEVLNRTDTEVPGFPAEQLSTHRAPDDLAGRIIEAAELVQLPVPAVQRQYEAEVPQRAGSRSPEDPAENQWSVWEISGLVLAAVVVLMAAVAGWRRFVRSRSRYSPSSAVLRRAKGAETRTRRQMAEAEATHCAEQVARLAPGAPTADTAVAHVEAARRLLDRTPRSSTRAEADVVGALVLLRRAAALAEEKVQPDEVRLTCWFNPLHPPMRRQVTWRDGQRTVTVPACSACADAVRKGREPDDILDLSTGSSTRHWFQVDLGVWSETGFGAFSRDLPGDLIREGAR